MSASVCGHCLCSTVARKRIAGRQDRIRVDIGARKFPRNIRLRWAASGSRPDRWARATRLVPLASSAWASRACLRTGHRLRASKPFLDAAAVMRFCGIGLRGLPAIEGIAVMDHQELDPVPGLRGLW